MANKTFLLEIFKNQPKKKLSRSSMRIRPNTSKAFRLQWLAMPASILVLLAAVVSAQGAVRSAQFGVSATVEDHCTVQSSQTISKAYEARSTSLANVQCALGTSYRLAMQSSSSTEFAATATEIPATSVVPQVQRTAAAPIHGAEPSRPVATSGASTSESLLLLTVEY